MPYTNQYTIRHQITTLLCYLLLPNSLSFPGPSHWVSFYFCFKSTLQSARNPSRLWRNVLFFPRLRLRFNRACLYSSFFQIGSCYLIVSVSPFSRLRSLAVLGFRTFLSALSFRTCYYSARVVLTLGSVFDHKSSVFSVSRTIIVVLVGFKKRQAMYFVYLMQILPLFCSVLILMRSESRYYGSNEKLNFPNFIFSL